MLSDDTHAIAACSYKMTHMQLQPADKSYYKMTQMQCTKFYCIYTTNAQGTHRHLHACKHEMNMHAHVQCMEHVQNMYNVSSESRGGRGFGGLNPPTLAIMNNIIGLTDWAPAIVTCCTQLHTLLTCNVT